MLRKIDRRVIRVENIEAAVRYYRDVLGLKLVRQEKLLASFLLVDGQSELVLHANPDAPYDEVYYLVDNVRDLFDKRASLKLRFVSPPAAVARGYRATVKDPFGNVLLLVDRTSEGGIKSDVIEDGQEPGTLFAGVVPRLKALPVPLVAAYVQLNRTADDLPYTPQFETLHQAYAEHFGTQKPTKRETWRHLLNIRKAGNLPRVGEAKSNPPDVDDEIRRTIRELLGDKPGRRDRLPYTPEFDAIVDELNKTLKRPLAPHIVWRLVATLAK